MKKLQFNYTQNPQFPGLAGLPFIPISIFHEERFVSHIALVDSGSTVNVLPYDLGLELGLVWEFQTFPLEVVGALAGSPAFGVVLSGQIEGFPSVPLVFAWTKKDNVRFILGQTNFFQAFKVSFNGKAGIFEIELDV